MGGSIKFSNRINFFLYLFKNCQKQANETERLDKYMEIKIPEIFFEHYQNKTIA